MSAPPTVDRRPLAFVAAALALAVALYGSSTPTPLYGLYSERFGLSAFAVTSVYAAYALGVLVTLLLGGGLSDAYGRRAVLSPALLVLAGSTAVFMTAGSLAALLAARLVQGVATGVITSAAGAALLDHAPRGDHRRAALVSSVAFPLGGAVGALAAGLLAQYAVDPMVLPYLPMLGLALGSAALVWGVLPPATTRSARTLRPQRVGVPAHIRRPFGTAALALVACWSVGGLFLALTPQLAAEVLHVHNRAMAGLVVFVLNGVGGLAQLGLRRISARAAIVAGTLLLGGGLLLVVGAIALPSAVLFLVATVSVGAGFGVAFMGSAAAVNAVAPVQARAEVLSAFYVLGYLAISVPAVVVGVASDHFGLAHTSYVFASAVVALLAVAAVGAHRSPYLRGAGEQALLVPVD